MIVRQDLPQTVQSTLSKVAAIDGLRAALDEMFLAVLLVDDVGEVLYANRAATRLCAWAGWLSERHWPDRPEKLPLFASLFRGQPCPSCGYVVVPTVGSDASAASVLVHVREHTLPNRAPVYIVYMSALMLTAPESLKIFSNMHGLSKTEHRILCQIYAGLTSGEIALVEKMSVHTVRAHTKAILKKTGLRRQSILIRQIEAFSQVSVLTQPSTGLSVGNPPLRHSA